MKRSKTLLTSSVLIATMVLSPIAALANGENAPVTSVLTEGVTESTSDKVVVTEVTPNADADAESEDVGLTPDNFFYFFKQLARDINLMFTFDDKKEAELLLKYANEKAAELKVLAEQKISEYDEAQMKEIEDLLQKAAELVGGEESAESTADEDQSDVAGETAENGSTTENTGTTAEDGSTVQEDTTDGTGTVTEQPSTPEEEAKDPTEVEQPSEGEKMGLYHALEVLKGLLDKLPEQGRKGVENAIKHIEKNIEKQEKKKEKQQKKHKHEEKKEQPVEPVEQDKSNTTDQSSDQTTGSTPGNVTNGTNQATDGKGAIKPISNQVSKKGEDQQRKANNPKDKSEKYEYKKENKGNHYGHEKQNEKDRSKKDQDDHQNQKGRSEGGR